MAAMAGRTERAAGSIPLVAVRAISCGCQQESLVRRLVELREDALVVVGGGGGAGCDAVCAFELCAPGLRLSFFCGCDP